MKFKTARDLECGLSLHALRIFRKNLVPKSGLILLTALASVTTVALAQSYPQKPIQLVVPTSAGGGTDMIARTVGQKLTAAWGETVLVDNRAGAGGNIGVALVAKARPDGHTLLIASS